MKKVIKFGIILNRKIYSFGLIWCPSISLKLHYFPFTFISKCNTSMLVSWLLQYWCLFVTLFSHESHEKHVKLSHDFFIDYSAHSLIQQWFTILIRLLCGPILHAPACVIYLSSNHKLLKLVPHSHRFSIRMPL
jgi:hypothetical protein